MGDVTLAPMPSQLLENDVTAPASEVLEHLETVLRSPAFAPSKRCQQFLRFVVLETLEGRRDSLKERTIAQGVFGKGDRFEPGEDSLVRVKAHEVRRRLADYYLGAPKSAFRIDLPLGGYVPRIQSITPATPLPTALTVSEPVVVSKAPAKRAWSRRRLLWLLGGAAAIVGTVPFALTRGESPLDSFWEPVFATKTPLLIFVPVLVRDGVLTDSVGLGPAAAISAAAQYLTEKHQPYHLRFGSDLTFAQLREQPSLLLGGFSSEWTLRMTRELLFQLAKADPEHRDPGSYVVDTKNGKQWGPIHTTRGYANEDYAILCRLFDADNGQVVLVAAGITTFGTEAAATMLFDPALFSKIVEQGPADWKSKNMQAVIHITIVGTTPSSPQVVATHFW
jgi:hypothetical protein